MPKRSMYIWKLRPILSAEGGTNRIVDKAKRARLSALWIKIADGRTPYENVVGATGDALAALVRKCRERSIEVWGWQVPHCASVQAARDEAATVKVIAEQLGLDGLIMDAEGGPEYFQGGKDEAIAYASAMRNVADQLGCPLAISSNDIPHNIPDWLPNFNRIAFVADRNYPQVYYGGSPSVSNRLVRAETANAHVTLPFCPVGAAWIGDSGGCASASACAERAATFIDLVKQRGYDEYSFWHWAGAPLVFWDVLNQTPA